MDRSNIAILNQSVWSIRQISWGPCVCAAARGVMNVPVAAALSTGSKTSPQAVAAADPEASTVTDDAPSTPVAVAVNAVSPHPPVRLYVHRKVWDVPAPSDATKGGRGPVRYTAEPIVGHACADTGDTAAAPLFVTVSATVTACPTTAADGVTASAPRSGVPSTIAVAEAVAGPPQALSPAAVSVNPIHPDPATDQVHANVAAPPATIVSGP